MVIAIVLFIIVAGSAAFFILKRSQPAVSAAEVPVDEVALAEEIHFSEPAAPIAVAPKTVVEEKTPAPKAAVEPVKVAVKVAAAVQPKAQPKPVPKTEPKVESNHHEVTFEIAPEFRGKHVMERKAAAEFLVQEWLVAHPEYKFVSGPTLVVGRKYVAKFVLRQSVASA